MQNYYHFFLVQKEFQDFPHRDVCRWRWLERCAHLNTLRPFSQQRFTTTGLNLRARRDNAGEKPQQCPAVFTSPTVGSSSTEGTLGTESNVFAVPESERRRVFESAAASSSQPPSWNPSDFKTGVAAIHLEKLKSASVSEERSTDWLLSVAECRKHDSNTVSQQIQGTPEEFQKKKKSSKNTQGNVKTCLKP